MAVARELVGEGIALQLNDVARRAGVGVATVYRHFPNSHALLEAIAEPCLQDLAAHGERALAADDPGEALATFLHHVIQAQITEASLAPVTAAHTDQLPSTTELKTRLYTVGSQLLSRAREAGAVRADLAPDDLVPLMCGIAYAATTHSGAPPGASAARYLQMVLTGLRCQHS